MPQQVIQNNFRVRKNFGKLKKIIEVPNLIDIQKRSYDKFLQRDTPTDERDDIGLQAVFKSVFPIKDFGETSSLEFVSYALDRPKYDEDECRARGMTFAAPIKVVVRLVVWDLDDETGASSIRDVKEQEVYFGEIPLMTEHGTFIINGTERVVVSQLHRSPGRVLRPRPRQDPQLGQEAVLCARDPLPRQLARLRVRPQGLHLRPHRPSAQALRDGPAARAGLRHPGAARLLLREGERSSSKRAPTAKFQAYRVVSTTTCWADSEPRTTFKDPKSGDTLVKKGRKISRAHIKRMRNAEHPPHPDGARRARRQGRGRGYHR